MSPHIAKRTFAHVIKEFRMDIPDYLVRPGAIARFLKNGMGP